MICIGDFANNPDLTRKSQLLHQSYIRGRHYMVNTITSTHVYKQISPTVKKNITHLFIYRFGIYGDLESIVEEMGAIYDKKKTLLQMYHEAVSEPYPFLYISLVMKCQKNVHAEFPKVFNSKLD